jgi:hypothetical protein
LHIENSKDNVFKVEQKIDGKEAMIFYAMAYVENNIVNITMRTSHTFNQVCANSVHFMVVGKLNKNYGMITVLYGMVLDFTQCYNAFDANAYKIVPRNWVKVNKKQHRDLCYGDKKEKELNPNVPKIKIGTEI